ncbi:MAG: flagellar motor switch protein FliN [Candidatus Fervidibacterota bacterium]
MSSSLTDLRANPSDWFWASGLCVKSAREPAMGIGQSKSCLSNPLSEVSRRMEQRSPEVQPVAFPSLTESQGTPQEGTAVPWEVLASLELPVHVELGRVELTVQELLEMTPGSVLELDKAVGEPVEVYVSGKLIAKGEVVVVLGERLGVRITELVKPT